MDDDLSFLQELSGDNVVTLDRKPRRLCQHAWVIDEEKRVLECSKCGQEKTAWDFVLELADRESDERRRLTALFDEVQKLKNCSPNLRAVRELER